MDATQRRTDRPTGRSTGAGVLDALGEDGFRALLLSCCDAPAWAERVAARRPFGTGEALLAAAAEELAATTEADVDVALAAHPRIGERPAGAASRREQAAALAADPAVLDALAEGNRAYEARFGHVYLVCASGRGAEELLAVLRSRLGNDPATERAVLRRELAAITDLRLRRALDEAGTGAGGAS
ncbi:2-oxo-4-hydroxy-4-carboxy-5-ureidoimidazoline decarboxylase [Kineococcus sp. SYSU DK005]|uniref:2-oxo-4-hydroxy-4-carboxy-5-ureidoimidazoline decarboxylase n=1 Tax=Kineococcus sp. SYSU DK005 TaxID=3383126 RepID=UPI003D7D4180